MQKYLLDGKEITEEKFNSYLECALKEEIKSENKFEEWLNEFYTPFGFEIGNATFTANEILKTLDINEYESMLKNYQEEQLDEIWCELEQSDYVFVDGKEFEIKTEN